MGMESKAKCRECGKTFKVEMGGGFRFQRGRGGTESRMC